MKIKPEWRLDVWKVFDLFHLRWRTGVNFINILRTNFSYKRRFGSFFYVQVTRENDVFVQKIWA